MKFYNNAQILIRRKIKARFIEDGMKIIKTKFPHAKLVKYKFDVKFKQGQIKDYSNRTMTIVFIDDVTKVKI